MTKNVELPFAMKFLDDTSNEDRGYEDLFTFKWTYDSKAQVSNTITMGPTLVLSSYQDRDSDTAADNEDD